MKEIVLQNKKNGMVMLLLTLVLYAVAIVGLIFGAISSNVPIIVVAVIWISLGWILFCGLKTLKPQEALVLTLFGNYVGTLRNEGFYFVNPFCTGFNPAAKTKLNQSGDVDAGAKKPFVIASNTADVSMEIPEKKISLKIMTLNNNRQKINDCLGNPVEIGIAVT